METTQDTREFLLLEYIADDPDVTQASLATQLGVAVGTVNWHLKRLVEKGYVKAKRAQRKKLRYLLTPEGLAFRAKLTVNYVDNSMRLYRRTRQRVKELFPEIRQAGFDTIRINGEGDLEEVIRLTCFEHGIKIDHDLTFPALEIRGWKVFLDMGNES